MLTAIFRLNITNIVNSVTTGTIVTADQCEEKKLVKFESRQTVNQLYYSHMSSPLIAVRTVKMSKYFCLRFQITF